MSQKPKILITAIHWAVASGRYMEAAFRRVGCDVKTCGPFVGNEIWGIHLANKYIWQPDVITTFGVIFDAGIKGALRPLDEKYKWRPDLIVNMDSAFDVIGSREDYPCPKVLYAVDNHVRNYVRTSDSWYDHYFLAHHDGPALPVDPKREDMTWLPCGYDPLVFTPSPVPLADRQYDVALLGYPYPERQAIIGAMKEAGLSVYGSLGPLYEEYRDIYHQARISLCVSAAGDVAQRVFETAAMGCAILTDPLADLSRLGAREGKHYVSYRGTNEAVAKAKELLRYPARLEDITSAGQALFAPGTWDARARVILDWLSKR
jgi:hypothetical protein